MKKQDLEYIQKIRTQQQLENAYNLVGQIHQCLCNDRKHEVAEDAFEIMRRIILLSQRIERGT